MAKLLKRIQFGNPILRSNATPVSKSEIASKQVRELIRDMRYTLKTKKYGVGLAAPQVGESISLAIIQIQPTKARPNLPKPKKASLVIINPKIVKTYGSRTQLWEGCISFAPVFAKVPRYKKAKTKLLR